MVSIEAIFWVVCKMLNSKPNFVYPVPEGKMNVGFRYKSKVNSNNPSECVLARINAREGIKIIVYHVIVYSVLKRRIDRNLILGLASSQISRYVSPPEVE